MPQKIAPNDTWSILGVIDHKEGLVRCAPDKNVPLDLIPEDLEMSCDCDHCQTKRVRNKTVYVQNESNNEIKRVGGSCIKYYLGYDYERVLKFLSELNIFQENFGGGFEFDSEYEYMHNGSCSDNLISTRSVVDYFVGHAKHFGYVSNRMANEYNKVSTSQGVEYDMRLLHGEIRTEEQYELYREIVAFQETITPATDEEYEAFVSKVEHEMQTKTFLVNAYRFMKSGALRLGNVKYLLSACSMIYGKVLVENAKANAKESKHEGEYVGSVGEKKALDGLEITFMTNFETQFGTSTIYKMIDKDGNVFVKFGTINERFIKKDSKEQDVCVGAVLAFTAEIKKHDTYNDAKQTTLGRLSKFK